MRSDGIEAVLCFLGAYRGFYAQNTLPLTPKVVNDIHKHGGTILKKSRGGRDTSKIVISIQDWRINQVYIWRRWNSSVKDFRVFLMPCLTSVQLLQNVIDKSFRFGTVVEEAQRAINAAHDEAESFDNCIGVVKLMGCCNLDYCLIPESPFYPEGLGGHMVIVIAEGARQDLLTECMPTMDQQDAWGNIFNL
ncbi:hypothetical protein Q3G72_023292 [Acer saccharum]|nr:hypothetical protein Q3G72_023292 [Acer saccharum]